MRTDLIETLHEHYRREYARWEFWNRVEKIGAAVALLSAAALALALWLRR